MTSPLIKIATRFYLPVCFEAAYQAQVVYLRDLIGDSFSAVIARFDGKKMDVFRVEKDMERLRPKMIAYVQTPEFEHALPQFEQDIAAYIKLANHEDPDVTHLIQKFSYLYQYAVIGSFVTNLWSEDLPQQERERIMTLATKYRMHSDYLVRALTEHFEKRFARLGWSQLCSLEAVKKGDPSIDAWKEEGFIFQNGEFFSDPWNVFLEKNNYSYQEPALEGAFGNELSGTTAFPGVVRGVARLVFSPRDLVFVQKGDVLISAMTTPSFSSVFSRISAIVTDEGGVTSHAAIIARELEKPCVIGTKVATLFLKDGDVIEVDAVNGIVKKI